LGVDPTEALLAATAVHAGFQAVVTVLVYPTFADIPEDHWPAFHTAHSHRIAGIVVVVYGLLVLASGWVIVAGPRDVATVTAMGAAALAILVTAFLAAPAHGRLSPDRGARDLALLVRADRVRLAAALVALGAAVVAVSH
jgi:hypothetical protein